MEINGKTYRNLESQVGYLTEVAEQLDARITEVAAQIPSKMIVEELPEVGDPTVTYYVGPKGTEPNQYYEVWVWVQEEPDGPFVWRELEDTDQVDLSGYLEKQTGTTTYNQIYAKTSGGEQTMLNVYSAGIDPSTVAMRDSYGRLNCANPGTGVGDGINAVNKYYADGHYLALQAGTTTYQQAYVKNTDGTQGMINISEIQDGSLVKRKANGRIYTPTPSDTTDAANKAYVDNNFLAKRTTSTSTAQLYAKNAAGTEQQMIAVTDGVWANGVPIRTSAGQINIPLVPVNDNHAASKQYVDAAVGQLLYLHDLELIITVDATNKLYVKAYLVNGSATAITTFDRIVYKRIDVQWGAFGPNIANSEAVAVSKLPDGFRQDEFEDPLVGFLYQYIDNGYLTSGKTNSSMSTTITDTVISW